MNSEITAIVGSTGKTGARVLATLAAQGYATRGLSRASEYVFDWTDRDSWSAALKGVSRVYVTYYPDLALPHAASDICAFVDLAKSLGVKHIVLLSGRGEEGARRAEDVVINSGLQWNVVRASWFMQNFSESFMLDGIQAGQLLLPETRAEEPFIDVNDIADVAVAALTCDDLRNQLLEVTGPELLTFDTCVNAIAKATHRHIDFQSTDIDQYLTVAVAQGLPDDLAWLINELFVNVLDGRNENTTHTVEQILGRPAKSFLQYVETTLPTGVWLAREALQLK
ncbi:NAD(P)H-binding protein [Echinimonas agarilytica]|uniref:NAD(P)H-binding protein n=1 Tax=Echinimonas agarilytica TaxID=1215918 RepID=A0AA42B8P0_9GAMM|nr:NAD(P)H-binding protein [Echinimonas agarilytica]MCM2680723.1 NAD(P)H-binding protein [Echinimonas agarilytica]